MSEKFLTVPEAIEKYGLNISKFQFALRKPSENGLYKVIYRKRNRVFLREDYLEKWLEENDVRSASNPKFTGRPTKAKKIPKERWKPKKGKHGKW